MSDCPTQSLAPPALLPGQQLLPSPCCLLLSLVECRKELCPPAPLCPAPLLLQESPGPCCASYSCDSAPNSCVYTLQEGKSKGSMVSKAVGEEWQDGPCRSCSCQAPDAVMMELLVSLGLEARDPEPSCSVQECRDGREEEVQYVVKEVREEGQCCPTRERVGCRDHQDRQRVEGEQWLTDPCTSHTCGRMEGRLEVEVTSLNCTKECPPGSSYSPGLEGQCCGSCSLVADCATVAGQGGQVGGLRIQVTSLP